MIAGTLSTFSVCATHHVSLVWIGPQIWSLVQFAAGVRQNAPTRAVCNYWFYWEILSHSLLWGELMAAQPLVVHFSPESPD